MSCAQHGSVFRDTWAAVEMVVSSMVDPPQEIAEFLNVEMSPRSRALQPQQPGPPPPEAEDASVERAASSKHVVESRTDQDCMDDGYRCAPGASEVFVGNHNVLQSTHGRLGEVLGT